MMYGLPVVEITGAQLDYLLQRLSQAVALNGGVATLSVCIDGGLKVKLDGGMWSPAIGKVRGEMKG